MPITPETAKELLSVVEELYELDNEMQVEIDRFKSDIKNAKKFFGTKGGRKKNIASSNFSILPNITLMGNDQGRPKRRAAKNADNVIKAIVSDNVKADKMRRPTIASSTAEKFKMAAEAPQENEFLHPGAIGNIAKGVKTKMSTRKTKASSNTTRVLEYNGNHETDGELINSKKTTRVMKACDETYDVAQPSTSARPTRPTRATRRNQTVQDSSVSSKGDESTDTEEEIPKKKMRTTRAASRKQQTAVDLVTDGESTSEEVSLKKAKRTIQAKEKNKHSEELQSNHEKTDEDKVPNKLRKTTRARDTTQKSNPQVDLDESPTNDEITESETDKPKKGKRTVRGKNKNQSEAQIDIANLLSSEETIESEEVKPKKGKQTSRVKDKTKLVANDETSGSEKKKSRRTTRAQDKTQSAARMEILDSQSTDETDKGAVANKGKRKTRARDKNHSVETPEQTEESPPTGTSDSDNDHTLKSNRSQKRSRSDDRLVQAETASVKTQNNRSLSSSRVNKLQKEVVKTPTSSPPSKKLGLSSSAMRPKTATPSKIPLSRSASARKKQDVDKLEQKKKEKELLMKKMKESEAINKLREEAAKKMLKEQEVLRKKEALMNDKKEQLRKKNIEKTQVAANKEALEREKREEMERLEREKEEKERLKREELEREREAQILKKKENQKKKFLEVEERRLKEEAARIAKLKEIEEEQKRQAEIAARQKEEAARLLQERKLKEEKMHKVAKHVLKEKNDNVNLDDYGIDSDDCDEDEEKRPKKPIPEWAKGPNFMKTVMVQNASNFDLTLKFFDRPRKMPNVKQIFGRDALMRARTSSACWSKPL